MTYAVITGASSGIGLELTHIAARNDFGLVLIARDEKKLQEISKKLSKIVPVYILSLDLSDAANAKKVYDFCIKNNLEIGVLINNAGFGDYGTFAQSDIAKQEAIIDLNIRSLTSLTRLFLPAMIRAKEGKIMNLGSVASFLPGPLMSVYYASKHYVLAFSESLAEELKNSGVTVTCLCPAPTESQFSKTAGADKSRMFARKLPTAAQVAEFGWHAMQRGQRVAIHGQRNRFLLRLSGLMPRSLVAYLVKKYQS